MKTEEMSEERTSSTAQEDEPVKSWRPVGEVINSFLNEYECYDGIEVDHKPTEPELFLIIDAVNGLLSDKGFQRAYGTWLSHRQRWAQEDESGKLRKAAEEVLEWLYGHFPENDPHIENLRKALEEK